MLTRWYPRRWTSCKETFLMDYMGSLPVQYMFHKVHRRDINHCNTYQKNWDLNPCISGAPGLQWRSVMVRDGHETWQCAYGRASTTKASSNQTNLCMWHIHCQIINTCKYFVHMFARFSLKKTDMGINCTHSFPLVKSHDTWDMWMQKLPHPLIMMHVPWQHACKLKVCSAGQPALYTF